MRAEKVEIAHTLQNRSTFPEEDLWAHIYSQEDWLARNITKRKNHFVAMVRAILPKRYILDIGCGPGAVMKDLGLDRYNVVGIDLSEHLLRSCKNNLMTHTCGASGYLVQGDAQQLPFAGKSFDVVVCLGVLSYLPSESKILGEAHRVLRPGGFLLIGVRNELSLANAGHHFRRILDELLFPRGTHFLAARNTRKNFIIWKLERLLLRSRFRKVKMITFGFGLRALRRLRIFPEKFLVKSEERIEHVVAASRLKPLQYLGDFYVGLFQRE